MAKDVKVIEINSNEVLFSCDISSIDDAYNYAEKMESMGLDVKIVSPSCPETLATSLGATNESLNDLKEMIDEEIKSHDITEGLGCAVCLPGSDLKQ